MNGFEPLRRRIIDYTDAGQWSEVYDGPIEGFETEQLKAENAKLRELVKDMWPHVRHRSRMCGECWLPCDTSDECLLYEPMRQRMRELGIEVDG